MPKYIAGFIGNPDPDPSDSPNGSKGIWNMIIQYYRKRKLQWPASGAFKIQATGGSIYNPGNNYNYHTFTSPGTFEINNRIDPTASIEILVIGGGGGGGDSNAGNGGGGGGAGGLVFHPGWPIPAGPYPISFPVQVGAGGAKAPGTEASGNDGVDSYFGPPVARLTGKGGGGGGFYTTGGNPGGCGGGGGGAGTSAGNATQPAQTHPGAPPGWTNYGNAGGPSGPGNPGDAGSGGGTDGAGANAGAAGNGRAIPGFEYPIVGLSPITPIANSPSNNQYGGGGGGEDYPSAPPFLAGQGGGGGTRPPTYPPPQISRQDGVDSTGGGGAAASEDVAGPQLSGDGGDGVVIIRYL